LLFANEEYRRRGLYVDRYSPIMWIDTALLCTRYAKQEQELYRHIGHRSRLDTFGIRVGGLQVPKEEEDPVRYLPLLLGLAALRLLRCVLGTGVGAGAQVALDLALVDEVVVVAFPDDPDAPGWRETERRLLSFVKLNSRMFCRSVRL
jgi:hypothetical protein